MFGIDDIIGAAGGIVGGILQGNAEKQAARIQAQAANHAADLAAQGQNRALNFTKGVYQNTENAERPYTETGTTALKYLASGLAPGGTFNSTPTASEVMALDPGFQFNLDEGMKALERAEAAGGSVGSGGALKAATQYATNYANGAFGDAYNRFLGTRQQNYNNLLNLANLGEEANRTTAGAGTSAAGLTTNASLTGAGMQGNDVMGAGNALAAGDVGAGNVWGAATNGLTNLGSLALANNRSGYGFQAPPTQFAPFTFGQPAMPGAPNVSVPFQTGPDLSGLFSLPSAPSY